MSTLAVPGARLSFEVIGSGPVLILIPGASGTGEAFRLLVSHLISHYRVATYDRRGFSRSTLDGPQDKEHRLATDADDVRRLLGHLTDQPAIVFGSSSGAIVALEVMSRSPEGIQTVVAHEPPVVNLLPDAAWWLAFFDGVYDTYCKQGVPEAMHQFASGALGSVDHQVLHLAMREHANAYTLSNATYWIEHELRQYPRAEIDLAKLSAHAQRIVLACGREAQDQLPSRPNRVLASQLGREIVTFPGGHLGFLTSPAEFASQLLAVLTS
jgi:pimeloyl-ACP methyl ester carboxylesterase